MSSGSSAEVKSKLPAPSAETDSTKSTRDPFKWLGEHRDGFLVGGAILYGLGYLVWSYNAWHNHLGQLPALEFQYLMSGIIPAAILVLGWAGNVYFLEARQTVLKVVKRKYFILIAVVFISSTIGWLPIAVGRGWIKIGLTEAQVSSYIAPLVIILFYFQILAAPQSPTEGSIVLRLQDFLEPTYRYVVPIAFCGYSIVLYLALYPSLPQQLGGPNPRCAYIDLVREDVAPSTLSALAASSTDATMGSGSKVVRSEKLDVYFSSSEYLLVRPAQSFDGSRKGAPAEDAPLYQVQKDVIRAIQWCR